MIRVESLVVSYGQAVAVNNVSIRVDPGELVALVGANGAGKSTLAGAIAGTIRPVSGSVESKRTALVPEGRQLFGTLTVDDNLQLGAWRLSRRHRSTDRIYQILPELTRIRHQTARTLSGGQQQMVAIGRALMSRPEVLVIDELSLGLAPRIVDVLVEHLRTLNQEEGLGLLLVEQNATIALELCERAYVMEVGQINHEGSSAELRASPTIARAYLGDLSDWGG
jgi:branched-chain amino acid transport system ATP-binding protein